MRIRTWVCAAAVLGAALTPAVQPAAAEPTAPARCDVRLAVRMTPDAVAPENPGFLASLVADPQYELRWIQGSDTSAVVELTGPGSDTQCTGGIQRLGRSSHVLEVKLIQPGQEPEQP